jgi:membrane associated rhomboid family serine protease
MYRSMSPTKVQFEVPAFSRAMKVLTALFVGLWLVVALVGSRGSVDPLGPFATLALVPSRVAQGQVWRLVTYAFLHDPKSIQDVLWTGVSLWFFGSAMEARWGLRRLAITMTVAALIGALVLMAVGAVYTPFWTQRAWSPAAATAMLGAAWCMANGTQQVSLLTLVTLTGRQCAALYGVVVGLGFLMSKSPESVLSLAGYLVGVVVGNAPAARPPRTRKESGPKLRVIRGGVDPKDLPN